MSKDFFPKDELIEFLKGYKFGYLDSNKLTDYELSDETYNPFDRDFLLHIYTNNGLLISIDKVSKKFIVRIGYNDGWIGGLSLCNCLCTFDMDKLDFNEFKLRLDASMKNPIYCFVTKYGSGSINEIIFKGKYEAGKEFLINLGYVEKSQTNNKPYFYNENEPTNSYKRLVYPVILPSTFINHYYKEKQSL